MQKPKTLPHQLTEHTKLLQKVALVSDDKVLVLKRQESSDSRPGCWDLPGGNAVWPETAESRGSLHQADAAREVLEETGIALDESVFDMNSLAYFDTYFSEEKQVYTIIANWWVELPDNFDEDKIEISDEHTEFAWVTAEDLADYDFGGKKGEFVLRTIEDALEFSQAWQEQSQKAGGCCGGGGCGGGGSHDH